MSGERTVQLPPHLQSAKLAFGELVSAFGGQVPAALETGKSQSRICTYGHIHTEDYPPLDVIDTLEARTVGTPGHPHVTRWLARRRGCELVRLPDVSLVPHGTSWSMLISLLSKEAGDLISGIAHDLSDNNDVDPPEARKRLRDAAELVRVAVQLEHALKQRAAEEGGGG